LHRRLEIARELADKGFRLSFHLDPVIIQTQKEWADYEDLARLLRDEWGKKGLFSVSMGTLRMKRDTFRAIRDKGRGALLKGLALEEGFYRYPGDVRREADERLGKVLEEGFGGCYYVCMD
jgi:DNA repair photolyase